MISRRVRIGGMLLAPIPAVCLGAWVMRGAGISAAAWGANLGAAVVGASLAAGALAAGRRRVDGQPTRAVWPLVAAGVALSSTLLAPGVDGVHRWLPAGPVAIHAAALLIPGVLVLLAEAGERLSAVTAVAVLLVLALQPDAAQAGAFFVGWGVIAVDQCSRWHGAAAIVAGVLVVAALLRPDPLDPVPHVEGILGMAAGQGVGYAVAGFVALLLVPLSFLALWPRPLGLALAAHVTGTLLAAWLGHHPVPMLGYGVAPILGYYVAVAASKEARGG